MPGRNSWPISDAKEAYAAIDRHRLTDHEPTIDRTKDSGKTWQEITSGLPAGVYLQTVNEDPKKQGLLVAGTELGVFVSFNDGDDWQSLQLNLPPTSNRDIAFKDNEVVLTTGLQFPQFVRFSGLPAFDSSRPRMARTPGERTEPAGPSDRFPCRQS